MREIKFRGLRTDGKGWVYGWYSPVIVPILGTLGHCINEGGYRAIDVIPETVGQFTGITDKNGKDIYEGDIIDIHQTVNGCNLFEIVWDKTNWNAKYVAAMVVPRLYEYNFDELVDVGVIDKTIEIIGNIHDL